MKNIQVENIQVGYSDRLIIEQLNLEIPLGKTTTIIGPNGCGKSTFLKAMGRILEVKKGTILLDGNNIHKMGTKEIARQLAILPQSPIPPEGVTVEELVSYGRFPYQNRFGKIKKEDKKIIDWAIEVTNLTEIKEFIVDNLSGGQRQRVWIAMALAQETDIILLDEPTTYLDMAYQLEVLELLEDLNQQYGCTIIMVLHDLNLAARFADHMIAFRDGKVVKAGTPNEVMTSNVLQQVYQIDANIIMDPNYNRPICLSYQLLNKKNIEKVKRGA